MTATLQTIFPYVQKFDDVLIFTVKKVYVGTALLAHLGRTYITLLHDVETTPKRVVYVYDTQTHFWSNEQKERFHFIFGVSYEEACKRGLFLSWHREFNLGLPQGRSGIKPKEQPLKPDTTRRRKMRVPHLKLSLL
ncbi:Hypothetical protein POVN_LOCUS29 [uncultured virus]|nr:Hypothetical protein POVN_LOCUS29 [uncultured virus]